MHQVTEKEPLLFVIFVLFVVKESAEKAISFDTNTYINLGQKYRGKTHSKY